MTSTALAQSVLSEFETSILNSVADAMILTDELGRIEFFNRAATDIFGYAPEDVIGKNLKLLMPAPVAGQHDSHPWQYRDTGKAHVIGRGWDVEGRAKDGRILTLWLQVGELTGRDGKRRLIGSLRDDSERKKLEADLRVSEARYRHSQSMAKIGHWTWTPGPNGKQGTYDFSVEAARILGVTPADLAISDPDYIERFVHPEDRPHAMKLFADIHQDRTRPYAGRYRIVRPDGEIRFVHERGEHALDDWGNILFTQGIIQDVTDQALLEEALRANEKRLRRDHQLARLGHWMIKYGADGRWENAVTMDSPEFNELIGLPPTVNSQTVGEFADQFVLPDDLALFRSAFDRLSDRGIGAYAIDYRIRRPDGSIVFVHEIGECVFDGAGRPISASGTAQDITGYKRMEESLRANESRLKEAQKIAELGSWEMDLRTGALQMSDECCEILGHDPAQRPPDLQQYLGYVHPEDRPRIRQLAAAEALGNIEPETYVRLQMKDGRIKHVVERKRMVFGADGKPAKVIGTTQDITERKLLEEALIRSKIEAETANQAKSDFLAHMTHELRTPLNAVIGFSDLILRGDAGPLTDKQTAYQRDIAGAGRHLLDTINDVLDLSKIHAGRLELQDEDVNLEQLIGLCITFVEPKAREKNLVVSADIQAGLPWVRGDALALKKIIINLLSNSVKFTPQGGSIAVKAALATSEGLCVSVSDTGIGMKPEAIPLVLQPFRQADNTYSRRYSGTGLGLSLAKSLTELHGGRLEISSEPGLGTTVSIHLPAERVGHKKPPVKKPGAS
jgi:PAS domain S-box-containing protein